MIKRFFVFFVVLAQAMVIGELAFARDFTDIITSGKLRVAIAEEDFLPWLARNETGEPIGFEIDIAEQLSEGLGVKPEFVELPFGDLIGALTAGEVDLIVSGLSITPDRARRVMFSNPYGQSDLELVVALPLLPDGAEEQSYDMEGMRIAVIKDTTTEIEGRSRFPESEIVSFADENTARDAFLNGDVNAIIAIKPYPAFIVSRDPENYASIGDPLTSTVEAVAIDPDNYRLLNYVNSWIAQVVASGFLEEATHYWFETLEWIDQVPGLQAEIEQGQETQREDE